MLAQLVALNDGSSILLDKPILLLGRHPECDIQIDSRKVSRRHCCIALVSDYLVVRDLGSTNGIRINGVRINEGRLRPGDELTIGNFRYRLRWEGPAAAEQAAPPGRAAPARPAAPASPLRPATPLDDALLESVKESVFPFNKFPGVDIILGPEMRSTGEVMGIADSFPMAFAKSQMAAGSDLPRSGTVFLSVTDRDKPEVVPVARALAEMGYALLATRGTAAVLRAQGIVVEEVFKLQEGRPNLIDHMKNSRLALIINTPRGKGPRTDEGAIRAAAVQHGVTCITTLAAAQAAVEACRALKDHTLTVGALQDHILGAGV